MPKRIFRFEAEVYGDVADQGTMPIYDEFGFLAGACILKRGNTLSCFVAGEGYPAALRLSSDDKFYLTSRSLEGRCVTHCILSERPMGPDSVVVERAIEEEGIVDPALEERNEASSQG